MSNGVCIVRHSYFPDDPRDRKQAYALVEAGFRVHVLCLRKPGQTASEVVNGVRVHRIGLTHRRAGVIRYFLEYKAGFLMMSIALLWLSARHRFRCIQVSTMPDFLVFSTMLPKLFGARVLLDLHEPTPELWVTKYGHRMRLLLAIQTWIEGMAIRYADRCITVTETLRQRFCERGADPAKITVVPNVCDESFDEARVRLGARAGASTGNRHSGFELVTHGLIEERYGHETVIRAVARLREELPDLRFTIIGDGEHRARLEAVVEELDCGDVVQFTGFIPFEELLSRLTAADAGVIAMLRSPYSELIDTNKMYEYVALRLPVLLSRLPAVEARFDDASVIYFRPGDDADLARAITELHLDRTAGQARAERAHAIYQQVEWRESKKEYTELVGRLCGKART